ncbi:MAG: hypothetical protein HY656_09665 [Acidobacteria bacterium]|nr:hypothetical protein [Acidobacteriota bacterium]
MRKTAFLAACLLVLAVGFALAGDKAGKGNEMTAAVKAAKLQEKLGLTDAQRAQVQTVFEEFHPRFEAVYARAQRGADVSAEKKKLQEERDARLKAIFTAEQWAKYEEMRAESHKKK